MPPWARVSSRSVAGRITQTAGDGSDPMSKELLRKQRENACEFLGGKNVVQNSIDMRFLVE
jgi:hypothetical protein